MLGRRAVLDDLGWVDADGKRAIAPNRPLAQTARIDLSDRAYVKAVRRTRQPYVSDAIAGRISNAPIVVLAVPTFDREGRLAGVLTGALAFLAGRRLDRATRERVTATADFVAAAGGITAATTVAEIYAAALKNALGAVSATVAVVEKDEIVPYFAPRSTTSSSSRSATASSTPRRDPLDYASAGHPPILLLDPEGNPSFLESGRSPALLYRAPRPTAHVTIARGSRLVLFSDGLVERKPELVDTGLARLAECARALRESTCEEFADGLLARLYDGAVAGDDVALLVVDLVCGARRTFDRK